MSGLLYGEGGTGKTSLTAHLANKTKFPFVKIINSEDLIGKSEYYKVNYMIKCFDDAYKSRRSLVILDDIERLVEYVEVGRRFNNNILQALMVLIAKQPEKQDHSIAILATSSNYEFLKDFRILSRFNIKIEVPQLSFNYKSENEIQNVFLELLKMKTPNFLGMKSNFRISIKNLIFIINMIKSNVKKRPLD